MSINQSVRPLGTMLHGMVDDTRSPDYDMFLQLSQYYLFTTVFRCIFRELNPYLKLKYDDLWETLYFINYSIIIIYLTHSM